MRGWCGVAVALAAPVAAQDAPAESAPATTTPAAPADPTWIATLSSGVLARDGDAARPFGVAGLSRKLGRGYVRVAATGFRSVLTQVDAVLPSTFALGSIGAGGVFGKWFVDGAATVGRQFYGDITTPFGTRAPQRGGSDVYGGSLDGGRFVPLARRLYLTPSVAVQYSAEKALRTSPFGDDETDERAWTGSGTLRLDRFFGPDSRHIAGVSLSRVQTSNGAVALAAGLPGGGPVTATAVGDGWMVAGASTSLRVARRLWLDGAASRTAGARGGDTTTLSLGVRLGF